MKDLEALLVRRILRLARMITNKRNNEIGDLGLTAAQADGLLFFTRNEGSAIADLAQHLSVTHQTACGLVNRMQEKGLVERLPSESDARAKEIFVTEHGKDLSERMEENGTHAVETMLQGMDVRTRSIFFTLIDQALENLQAADEKGEQS